MPARMAILPFPFTSQATPRRGANQRNWVGMSCRFGPSLPPGMPRAVQGFVPGGYSTPLQEESPRAGLTDDRTKFPIRSSAMNGGCMWLKRMPKSTVQRGATL